VKSCVQGSAESIHLGSFVHIGSPSISAPFLIPFAKFSVPLWGVMYILDRFILCFRGNKLGFKCISKIVPCSVVDWVSG